MKNEETQKRGERGRQRQTDRQTDRVGYLPPLSFVPFYLLIPLCLRSQRWILWPEMSTNLKTISLGTVALDSLLSVSCLWRVKTRERGSKPQRCHGWGERNVISSFRRHAFSPFPGSVKYVAGYICLQQDSLSIACHSVLMKGKYKDWGKSRLCDFFQIEGLWQSWIKQVHRYHFFKQHLLTLCLILRLSPEPLEWEHWLQDPGLPEN